jgi:Fic family protein
VVVGRHLPPEAAALPSFLDRFEQAQAPAHLSKMRQVIAVAAAHHRFVWIHPFFDGNGRVVRLMSHAMLKRLGVGSSLWSVARGLARNVGNHKALLMAADGPRRNDLDGQLVSANAVWVRAFRALAFAAS